VPRGPRKKHTSAWARECAASIDIIDWILLLTRAVLLYITCPHCFYAIEYIIFILIMAWITHYGAPTMSYGQYQGKRY
jgi:uncharacterized RDD family membrane protein YckC